VAMPCGGVSRRRTAWRAVENLAYSWVAIADEFERSFTALPAIRTRRSHQPPRILGEQSFANLLPIL